MNRTAARAALALTGTLAALGSPSPCGAQEDRKKDVLTSRTHDVSGIRTALSELEATSGPTDVRPFGPGNSWGNLPERFAIPEPGPSTDALLELARSTLPPELAETAEMDTVGDATARVRTTDDGHRRVEALLDALRAAWGSPYEIDVRVVTVPEDDAGDALLAEAERAPGGRLGPDLVARFLAADPRRGTRGAAVLPLPGRWALVESVRDESVAADFDVEIAEDASISDPVTVRVEEGVRAAVRALPLSDGRAVVSVAAAAGDLLQLRRFEMRTTDLGSVELPEAAAAFAATEMVLAPGEGTAVVLAAPTSASSASRYVVLVRLVGAPSRADTGDLVILPVGALADVPMAASLGPAREQMDQESHERFGGGPVVRWTEGTSRASADVVVEQMHADAGEAIERAGTFLSAAGDWPGGGAVLVQGPRDVRTKVTQTLERMEKASIATVWTSIRLVETPPTVFRAEEALKTGRTVAVLAGPVAPGRLAAFAAYRATAYVGEYDVEVAQKARIADPGPRVAMGGVLANLRLARAAKGAWRADLSLRASSAGAIEISPAQGTEVGALERIPVRRSRFSGSVILSSGAPRAVDLGESPWRAPGSARLWAVLRME